MHLGDSVATLHTDWGVPCTHLKLLLSDCTRQLYSFFERRACGLRLAHSRSTQFWRNNFVHFWRHNRFCANAPFFTPSPFLLKKTILLPFPNFQNSRQNLDTFNLIMHTKCLDCITKDKFVSSAKMLATLAEVKLHLPKSYHLVQQPYHAVPKQCGPWTCCPIGCSDFENLTTFSKN